MSANVSPATQTCPAKRPSFFADALMLALVILINHLLHPKPQPVPELKPGLFQPSYRIPLEPSGSLTPPPFHGVNNEVSPH